MKTQWFELLTPRIIRHLKVGDMKLGQIDLLSIQNLHLSSRFCGWTI
ncbi:MAG: hypothetical protein ABI851_11295 [Saprospiraceae bacterium]